MNKADRFLELSLLFALVVHILAVFSMALLLIPAMPGLGGTDEARRLSYIAEHPWLWHVGWLPWHLCALSDLLLSFALIATKWVPSLASRLTLVLTIVAVAIEQPYETIWNIDGPRLAQAALANNDLSIYLEFEKMIFLPVCVIAAVLYSVMAMGWSWCLSYCGKWTPLLTWLSVVTWVLLLLIAPAPLLAPPYNLPPILLTVGNALGFNLMVVWFILVMEAVLRRTRVDEAYGRMSDWRLPRTDITGRFLTAVGNSRFAKYVGEFVPALTLISDIENVVYINYLVEAERLLPLVPDGLDLQRLGPEGRYGLFSILTYRHGNFGPRIFGPLRKLMPSPVQSNWRIHVRYVPNSVEGIYFLSTCVDSLLVAMGARTVSDGVPMHVPARAGVTANGDIKVSLDPGSGSAPDLVAELRRCEKPVLSGAWEECFLDYDSFLKYCVPQDRAMSSQPWYNRITAQEIHLGIPLSDCQPLTGTVMSQAVQRMFGEVSEPICFLVPKVNFRFDTVKVYVRDAISQQV